MFELYTVQGLSIGAIAHLLNEQAIPTCKRRGRWERSTVWACCEIRRTKAKPALVRRRLHRANGSRGQYGCVAASPLATAPATSSRGGLDHDRRAADRQRRGLCARAGTAPDQQDSRAAADRHAQRRARSCKLRQVRLRSLSHIDAIERTRDPLLSMSRLRRLAATFRLRLQQPPSASGSSGRGCLGGNRAAARRSRTHP